MEKENTTRESYFSTDNKEIRRYLNSKLNSPFVSYRPEYYDIDEIMEKPKEEIIRILQEKLPREQLLGLEAEKELWYFINSHDYLAHWSITMEKYRDKIHKRTLKKTEYDKIHQEIAEEWSVLPTSSKRNYWYQWGSGSVILSSTTGKMYCVENDNDRNELLSDYKWYQYYYSQSGLSGAWYIHAGKRSLIYLPTIRIDIAPENPNTSNVNVSKTNWLIINARSNRGVVDKNYPITMQAPEWSDYDFVFIDPNNVQQTIDIIKSWWTPPQHFKRFSKGFWHYVDETGTSQQINLSYLAENELDDRVLKSVFDWSGKLDAIRSQLQLTWSEFDRVLWVYKSWDNYVKKGDLWVARKLYGKTNPRDAIMHIDELNTKGLFEYNVWPWWVLEKEYYAPKFRIKWWTLKDKDTAYRDYTDNEKNLWKYIVMKEYDFSSIANSPSASELCKRFSSFFKVWLGNFQDRLNNISIEACPNWEKIIIVLKWVDEGQINNFDKSLQKKIEKNIEDSYGANLKSLFDNAVNLAREWQAYTDWWETHGNLIYSAYGNKVFLWYITKESDLNPKFSAKWDDLIQDFEMVIDYADWVNKWQAYREGVMRDGAYAKSVRNYIYNARRSENDQIHMVRNYLENNKDKEFFIADSLQVWNCLPGTEWFMEQNNVTEGISGKTLLKHENINKMLKDRRFRNVILGKIRKFDEIEESDENQQSTWVEATDSKLPRSKTRKLMRRRTR